MLHIRFRKRHVIRPSTILLNITELTFVTPENTMPLVIDFDMRTYLNLVLVNQIPDYLLKRNSPCGYMKA